MKDKNYCGMGKSAFIKPPHWAFLTASCKIHDENYTRGGNRADRLKADVGFLKHMLIDISELPYCKKKKATRWAVIYYITVRTFGWMSWTVQNYKNKNR